MIGPGASLVLSGTGYGLDLTEQNFKPPTLGVIMRPVSAQLYEVRRLLGGAAAKTRQHYEPHLDVLFDLFLSADELETLELIHAQQHRLLKLGTTAYAILSNARQSFVESAPRTRALVAGTTEFTNPPAGAVQYYPRLRLLISLGEGFYKEAGRSVSTGAHLYRASFTGSELDKVLP